MDVLTGSRPARPRMLLLLCGGVLVAMLALAGAQVRYARALGPRVLIPGVPLSVQPPRGWRPDVADPRVFRPTVGHRVRGGEGFFRQIVYSYERRPAFVSPRELMREIDVRTRAESVLRPARLAGFDGVEAVRVRSGPYGHIQTLHRLAVSPRGDVVSIEYQPLADLDGGDLALMESLASAIRVDDATLSRGASQLLADCGVELGIPSDWRVCGPDLAGVPGFYGLGMHDDRTDFALLVMRTWLANGRTPLALLGQIAESDWRVDRDRAQFLQSRRPDGASVVLALHPEDPRGVLYPSVRLVSLSPDEALLIAVSGASPDLGRGNEAAEWLAQHVRFARRFPELEAAQAAGARLAREIATAGLERWWGRAPSDRFAAGAVFRGHAVLRERRGFVEAAPKPQYAGHALTDVSRAQREVTEETWEISGDGLEYTYTFARLTSRRDGRIRDRTELSQRRARDPGVVTFTRRGGDGRRAEVAQVGDAFVAPPVEALAESIAAHADSGDWLIEAANALSPGTHTRLLRARGADADGRRGVLVLSDYWPVGALISRDNRGSLLRYEQPPVLLSEVDEHQARQMSSLVERLD
ncbi:MAG TPA: hypothetical protein PKC49_04165 [Phycisphaerae bacterium]|nr:hypothetical protein [Phycisphaerae bacterium]